MPPAWNVVCESLPSKASTPLVLYLKEENNFGADKMAGLDAVARMVADGTCVWIKYAVVRKDPKEDAYLEALLARVDKSRVVSGIGERPAIVHMRDWSLPGFTTGSGCIAPAASLEVFRKLRPPGLRPRREFPQPVHSARRPARRLGAGPSPARRDRTLRHRDYRADSAVRESAE